MICKPDCLFSQSEGQILVLHVLSQQSIYGTPEAESLRDRERDFHEFRGSKMFTISHLSTMAYTDKHPKRNTLAEGKKRSKTMAESLKALETNASFASA